tara:strand:+ start:7184 stop:10906 length:3723 start_codon:yes stop_codon:yes gene_type:complete
MNEEEQYNVETSYTSPALNAAESLDQQVEQAQKARTVEQNISEEDEQIQAELDDPRNKENWGLKAVAKELQSVVTGGIQDTLSSVATFPERTIDAVNGNMVKERRENGFYKPDWTPFNSYDNPIITRTWWGKLARGTVHFGTLAAGTVLAAKGAVAAGVPIAAVGATKLLGANSLVRAAGVGAISDLVSKESDAENALGSLRDHYGFIDTPLSTREADHPIMMKLKNIVEGMGIGLIFDGAAMAIGKGSKPIRDMVQKRNQSIRSATTEKALDELRNYEEGFRASKNKPLADAHQGAHLSEDDPYLVFENQKRIRNEFGAEDGSAGNLVRPIQRERGAMNTDYTEEVVEDILSKLYSNNKFKKVIDDVRNNRESLTNVFGDSIAAHQRITAGRDAAEMSAADYLQELYQTRDTYDITDIDGNLIDTIETFTSKNVAVADLLVSTLLQQVRDLSIGAREMFDFVDVRDIDGPLDQVRDTMFLLLTEVKKARIIKSQNFAELGAGKKRGYLRKTLSKEMVDTRESIQAILDIADDDGDMLMALFEAFSSMQTVNSIDDFNAWARKMIKGGEIEGKQQKGALIRELEGVFSHSVLSGPKTPARAIVGTSAFTFTRPMAQTLGAVFRYPFTGDSRTIRTGLASMNAMIEAIPESFELFKTRLSGYWSGEIATVKTRFSDYTEGDQNWEILRRFAEDSPDATVGDKAAYYIANIARTLNATNFLTYSTKLMAATDDAFGFIIGRAKMKEKALLSALDAKAVGALSDDITITPELIKSYENKFYRDVFDANGNVTDEAAGFARKEVTLTQDLTGFAAGLNSVFQQNPWAKPFFLFARTGVNGLALTAKHTPGFNFFVKEFNEIAMAKPGQLTPELASKYGITSDQELINAKALQTGRLAMGAALVFMASQKWMRGEMTGNGPVDRQMRQSWLDAGYKQRTLTFGDVQVGYDTFEPFNLIMSTVADIGDASLLMGEEWTEDNLLKVALLVSQGVTSKSYLAGLQSFADLFSGKPGRGASIGSSFMNNSLFLGATRRELGKLFNPGLKELNSGIEDSLRNQNLYMEAFAGKGEKLPTKYDLLNGKPVNPYDFMTRAFNMFSPINFNLTPSKGRQLLFASKYDARISVLYSPEGDDLTDENRLRSRFQQEIGKENLEAKLERLSRNPRVIASIEQMNKDIASGLRSQYEAKDYYHYQIIDDMFEEARNVAWARMTNLPEVTLLREKERLQTVSRMQKSDTSANLLSMYK